MGIDRLLKLYEKYDIKATWVRYRSPLEPRTVVTDSHTHPDKFTPAHSLESFPKQLAKVRDAGHELGLHGYTHEFISQLSATQQQDVLTRSIAVLTDFCGGKKPLGYTAPSWSTSKELIPQLEAEGILYDHSFMHHDLQPYYAPDSSETWIETNHAKAADHWMSPMSKLKPSKVVEIPSNWHLDDWPPLQVSPAEYNLLSMSETVADGYTHHSCSQSRAGQARRGSWTQVWWRSCGWSSSISRIESMTRSSSR